MEESPTLVDTVQPTSDLSSPLRSVPCTAEAQLKPSPGLRGLVVSSIPASEINATPNLALLLCLLY